MNYYDDYGRDRWPIEPYQLEYAEHPHTGTSDRDIACPHKDREDGSPDPNHGQRYRGEGMLVAILAHKLHAGHSEWMGVKFQKWDDDFEDCFALDKDIAQIYTTFAYIGEDTEILEYKNYEDQARAKHERRTMARRVREQKEQLLMEQFGWKD